MPNPTRADHGDNLRIHDGRSVPRKAALALLPTKMPRPPVLKWGAYVALPLLLFADLLAFVELVPWLPTQLHSVGVGLGVMAVIEWYARRRSNDAVTSYQLGVMAGRLDQQREWEVVYRGVRPLPRVLHQNVAHLAADRADASVLTFPRRYPPA